MASLLFPRALCFCFVWAAGWAGTTVAQGDEAFPTMPDRGRLVAVFDGTAGDPATQGWQERREGEPEVVTVEDKSGVWWITDRSNGMDGVSYGLDITPEDQSVLKEGWLIEVELDLQESDTPQGNSRQPQTTCDLKIMKDGNEVLHHLTFAFTPDGDHGKRKYSWEISGIEHQYQQGDKVQVEMRPKRGGEGHGLELRISGVARSHFGSSSAPSVPTRIEWGSPPSDGTSRAGWKQVTLHQADWSKVDQKDQAAQDAVSPEQLTVETGWDFSIPFPSHRLEVNLLGTPPLAVVGKDLVACAPNYHPSDRFELLIFVVSPRSEPMTTGLYWYVYYRRGTRELNQILVMDQSRDEWLQDGPFKNAGYAKPGESAAALIQRYRAEMIRRTEADPKQAHKKEWVEASADLALAIDKLWAKHRPAAGSKRPLEK